MEQLLDDHYMQLAVRIAREYEKDGERPFGCVLTDPTNKVIGTAGGTATLTDPTRHSEIEAIRMACRARGALLYGCSIYSTHEPCIMCTGAIHHAKIARVIYGSSREDLPELFHALEVGWARWRDTSHPPFVIAGVRREECVALFAGELARAR